MVDHRNGVIVERVQRLLSYVNELRNLQDEVPFEIYQQDKFKRKFIERTLHTALEACLDIGHRLISVAGLRQPEDNRDVFVVLTEAGILTPTRLAVFKRMAGFRNILVHEYAKLDDAAVYGVFQRHLDDFTAFAEALALCRCRPAQRAVRPAWSRFSRHRMGGSVPGCGSCAVRNRTYTSVPVWEQSVS